MKKKQWYCTNIYGDGDDLVRWINNWSEVIKIEHIVYNPKEICFTAFYRYNRKIKEMQPSEKELEEALYA